MNKLMMLPLLGLLMAGTAMAESAPQPGVEVQQQKGEAHLARLTARLGLDAATASSVKSTFERYRAEMQPLRKDMFQTSRALETELAGAKDATRLSSLTAQLGGDRARLQSLGEARNQELQKVLTPAQYAQLIVARHGHLGRRFHHERSQ